MKRVVSCIFLICISFLCVAKPWPSNSLALLKQNQGIQLDYRFVGSMLGRNMSDEYPQLLLKTYKSNYPDYFDFERYTIRYKNTADPLRVNLLKSLVRSCDFTAIWRILESNSVDVQRLKNNDSVQYGRLKASTIANLKSGFGSVEKFVEEIAINPSRTIAVLNLAIEQATKQIANSSSYSSTPTSPSSHLSSHKVPADASDRTYTYKGTIGPYKVHMTLTFRPNNTVIGSYYYDTQRAKGNMAVIRLSGTYRGELDWGSIVMDEYTEAGKKIGSFVGELDGTYEIDLSDGERYNIYFISSDNGYKNLSSGKVYPIDLTCEED